MKKALLLALVAGAAMAAPAMAAPYTFTAFNSVVNSTASFVSLAGVPAGTYNSYSVSIEWSAIAGDPYSNEAIWAFTSTNDLGTATFYADPGVSPVAANSGVSRTLTWSGLLDVNYTGGSPLFMAMLQTFSGSSANWNNISITLDSITASVPTTLQDFGAVSGAATAKNQLTSGGIHWYSFQHDGSNSLAIDTLGTSIPDTDNDTEIGLYSSDGTLIATNDDIDFLGGIYMSSLNFAAGDLASGTYYIAAGGYNTTFGNGFGVTTNSTAAGSLRVNIAVPAPAGAGVLALAGLVAARRRRN